MVVVRRGEVRADVSVLSHKSAAKKIPQMALDIRHRDDHECPLHKRTWPVRGRTRKFSRLL